jgi:hypothetical protein
MLFQEFIFNKIGLALSSSIIEVFQIIQTFPKVVASLLVI